MSQERSYQRRDINEVVSADGRSADRFAKANASSLRFSFYDVLYEVYQEAFPRSARRRRELIRFDDEREKLAQLTVILDEC